MKSSILLFVATAALATNANAHILHFVNPAPGETGHYNWYAPVGIPRWIDVTLPAEHQTDHESRNSIAQGIGNLGFGFGILIGGGVWPTASRFAIDQSLDPMVLALSPGDGLGGLTYDSYTPFALFDPPSTQSLFPEGARRYIGMQTGDGNYGWIEVERTGLSLAAFSWAYETRPGVPIAAGQVPTPGAALPLGAAVLLMPRRRRN